MNRHPISKPIQGKQLALVIEVQPLVNPICGEQICTRSGRATVTHTEAIGQERLIWADYGSGIAQPHVSEGLLPPKQLVLEPPLQVGDRVRVKRGCFEGLVSVVTAVRPELAHSVALEPGKGRFRPEILERVAAPVELPPEPSRPRRHSPKGQASGWIEERVGNRKRKTPSISYYYRWEDSAGRHSRYIPAGKLWRVQQLVEVEGRLIGEVLEVLGG